MRCRPTRFFHPSGGLADVQLKIPLMRRARLLRIVVVALRMFFVLDDELEARSSRPS